jgi:hypothetical protein
VIWRTRNEIICRGIVVGPEEILDRIQVVGINQFFLHIDIEVPIKRLLSKHLGWSFYTYLEM